MRHARQRLFLVLGISGLVVLPCALAHAASSWQLLHGAPRFASLGSAVVEPDRHRLYVFGPPADANSPMELWSLSLDSLAAWRRERPLGPSPAARWTSRMFADPARDRLLFYGGLAGPLTFLSYAGDFWELSLAGSPTWRQLSDGAGGPEYGSSGSVVFDAVSDRLVSFGGDASRRFSTLISDKTFSIAADAPGAWSRMLTSAPPSPRGGAAAALDATGSRMVVAGGATPGVPPGDTWQLTFADSSIWRPLQPTGATPPLLTGARAWTDSAASRLRVIPSASELWSLDLARPDSAAWSVSPISTSPSPANGPFAWDEQARSAWQFDTVAGSLWRMSLPPGAAWSLAMPSPDRVPARYGGPRLVHDAQHIRTITLFGYDAPQGTLALAGAQADGDTLLGWTPFAVTPAPRTGASVVCDAAHDRLLVFAGESGTTSDGDLWEYQLSSGTWTALTPEIGRAHV